MRAARVALLLAAVPSGAAALQTPRLSSSAREHGTSPRRRVVAAAAASLSLLVPCESARAEDLSSDALDLGGELLAFGPFGILSFGLKKRAVQQKACYDAGECLDAVNYYRIQCERGDAECLARKRRLANQDINNFFANPASQPGLLVFAFLLSAGPVAAFTRALAALATSPDDDDDDGGGGPPSDEPPRKKSYGPGLPW